ncbi:hypothetical protein NE237_013966 [Protea cynaroides]|uniref:Uncharacterized protein n=1 Tax=Protea cynaroides TaxID=273540 RepID=A0A9Q0K0N1_9MAGN|nr:hypothetical protein NE237_013966 [Protea cynaroides]
MGLASNRSASDKHFKVPDLWPERLDWSSGLQAQRSSGNQLCFGTVCTKDISTFCICIHDMSHWVEPPGCIGEKMQGEIRGAGHRRAKGYNLEVTKNPSQEICSQQLIWRG